MATITTSTQAQGFSYPSASYMDMSPVTGNLIQLVRLTSGELRVYSSSNNGSSWVDTTAGFNRANLQEWSSLYIDVDGFAHVAYRVYESGKDRIYYRRAGLNSSGVLVWDTELLVAEATAASSGLVYQGVDIMVTKTFDEYQVFIPVGTTSGANIGVTLLCLDIYLEYDYWWGTTYWVYHVHPSLVSGTRSWFIAGTGRVTPAIDIRHNGDGHNSSVPDLWIAFGRAQTCVVRLSYNGNTWSGTPAITILATPSGAMDHNPGRFDGTRFLVPSFNGSKVDVYERDVSNTNSTLRQSPTHPQGVIRYVGIAYAPQTGDFRLVAVGTSSTSLYYVDYIRASNTWGAWTLHVSSIINANNFGIRRSAYGNARYDTYTQTGSSPYTLSTQHNVLAFAPNTPSWVSPTSGSAADVGKSLTVTWLYTDPNTSDVQASYALSRQIGAGALAYWRASDSTWQPAEVQNVSGTSSVILPAGWGLDADDTHNYRVKTWDATGLASAYSSALAITPSTPITPVINVPAMASSPVMSDTFTRVGNLAGSTPDLAVAAATWTLASGSATVWTTDGTKLISAPATSSAAANINYVTNYNNSSEISFDFKVSTLASAVGTRDFTIFMRMTGANFIGLGFTINAAGVPAMFFRKTTSAGTSFPWGANLDISGLIPSGTAKGATHTFKFGVVGQVVYAVINGTTFTRFLTAAEVASLGGNLQFRTTNTAGTPSLDMEIDNWQVNGLTMATFTGPTVRAEWTATGQTGFRIRLYNVTSGDAILENDTGWQTSTISAYTFPLSLADLNYYSVQLEVRNAEGLASQVVERTFYVDYTEPTTPTYIVSPNSGAGAIVLSVTNPKETGTQPAVITNNIYRRETGDTSIGTKIAAIARSTLRANLLLYDANDRESVESNAFGWNSNNGAVMSVIRDNATFLDGAWSLRLAHLVGGSVFPGAYADPVASIPVLANTQYTFSFWVKAGGTPRTLGVTVQARGGVAGATNLGNIAGAPTVNSVSASWTQFSWTFTTPASTTFLTITMGSSTTNAGLGEAHYFDRIEVYKVGDVGAPIEYNDFTAKHGVDYEYRVQSVGVNGAVSYGAWVA